jgi:hypothetical protein
MPVLVYSLILYFAFGFIQVAHLSPSFLLLLWPFSASYVVICSKSTHTDTPCSFALFFLVLDESIVLVFLCAFSSHTSCSACVSAPLSNQTLVPFRQRGSLKVLVHPLRTQALQVLLPNISKQLFDCLSSCSQETIKSICPPSSLLKPRIDKIFLTAVLVRNN